MNGRQRLGRGKRAAAQARERRWRSPWAGLTVGSGDGFDTLVELLETWQSDG